mgnify:CR=1 FL=1
MKLTRIRLEQFCQFRAPLEIDGLEAGLNVFTGPNEAGKSTLVAAIRAAFFERHRSKRVEHLQPWGDSSAAPSVELDFTLAQHPAVHTRNVLLAAPRALAVIALQDGVEVARVVRPWKAEDLEPVLARLQPFSGDRSARPGH